ncbi:hypothetical protein HY772_01185 [Candidatus Woesearchaeota archaeon]|nr:hypothetical protein [Candidatus Woesearchaeota archaeon]
MNRFFDLAARLSEDTGFLNFQNEITRDAYDALGQAYAANGNEVEIVTKLVEAVKDKSYDRIHISASKIHGSRSYVEFNFRDKPTTKELGDMAIITVVTSGKTRLLQRLCIIQNKKAKDQKWGIDPEQLFLLKNFPPFAGNRGIFRGMSNVVFRNRSGCLGAFGLLSEPGEMMFVAAPVFAEILRDRSSLSASEIGLPSLIPHDGGQSSFHGRPLSMPPFDPKEWHMIMREFMHEIGPFPWMRSFDYALPFFGNVHYGRDMYDFVRAWTQINLGEFTCLRGTIINAEVDGFANHLIRSAGMGRGVDFPTGDQNVERKFEGGMTVFLLRVDVEHKG